MPKVSSPSYRRQKEKGRPDRAYAIVNGQRVHLGVWGTAVSYQRYAEKLSEPAVTPTKKPAAEPAPTAYTIRPAIEAKEWTCTFFRSAMH